MPLVWGGWEGGHSGGRGREIWFEPHGVYNLQRDRPPWLPEGDGPGDPGGWGGVTEDLPLAVFLCLLPFLPRLPGSNQDEMKPGCQ